MLKSKSSKKQTDKSPSLKSKNPTPIQIANNFLTENNFFNYLQTEQYSAQLKTELSSINKVQFPYTLKLKFNKKTSPSDSNQNHYSLELGGTYLKIFEYQIKNTKPKIIRQIKIDFYKKITYTPNTFFSEIQKQLEKFLSTNNKNSLNQLTLILAFPLKPFINSSQQIDGQLLNFSKHHKQKGLLNTPIGEGLQKHLSRQGYTNIQISVINDSTANLLAEFSENPTSQFIINLIVGTGTNLSLFQKKSQQTISQNLEFGQFKGFPSSKLDQQLRTKYPPSNSYQCEKMFTGAWQNILFKIAHQQLIKKHLINKTIFPITKFTNLTPAQLEHFFILEKKEKNYQILRTIWQQISLRGAYLCATTTAQLIKQIKPTSQPKISIIFQGAILENSKFFRTAYQNNLKSLLKTSKSPAQITFKIIKNVGPKAALTLQQAKPII